jgi:hypothetical protein
MVKVSVSIQSDTVNGELLSNDIIFAVSGDDVSIHIPGTKDGKIADRDVAVDQNDLYKMFRVVFGRY